MTDPPRDEKRLLTFASGGWVLLAAIMLCVAVVGWALAPAVLRIFNRPPGDGQNVESYGFDLSTCLVSRTELVPATLYRDMVPVMDDPQSATAAEIEREDASERGKYLVSADRVVGVQIGGAARAYPVSVLTVHEVVNDTLDGVPIAVTYHWPCDSVMVFDRRVNGNVLTFGHSGLVFNSNLLVYDRQAGAEATAPQPGASLWLQLEARAVAGPAAGTHLEVVPSRLTTWAAWSADHPETTVLRPWPDFKKRYRKASPSSYFRQGEIAYPVAPWPPEGGPPPLTRVVAVSVDGARRVYPLPYLDERADVTGRWSDELGGRTLRFTLHRPGPDADKSQPPSVDVTAEGPLVSLSVVPCAWFAWHAMHPDDPLAGMDAGEVGAPADE